MNILSGYFYTETFLLKMIENVLPFSLPFIQEQELAFQNTSMRMRRQLKRQTSNDFVRSEDEEELLSMEVDTTTHRAIIKTVELSEPYIFLTMERYW